MISNSNKANTEKCRRTFLTINLRRTVCSFFSFSFSVVYRYHFGVHFSCMVRPNSNYSFYFCVFLFYLKFLSPIYQVCPVYWFYMTSSFIIVTQFPHIASFFFMRHAFYVPVPYYIQYKSRRQ